MRHRHFWSVPHLFGKFIEHRQERLCRKSKLSMPGFSALPHPRFLMIPAPTNIIPSNPSKGSGEAVAGSSSAGSEACATGAGSGSMEPVKWTDAVLVAEPPQGFVAVIV